MRFLEDIGPDSCIGYLEHVIDVWEENGAEFHDKLSELYLAKAQTASKDQEDGEWD